MKKYYGYFSLDGKEYVIRFKIKGSLQYDPKYGCFTDKDWYVRGIDDVVAMAAGLPHPMNMMHRNFWAFLIDHNTFVEYRTRGYERWVCEGLTPIINWD